MRWARGLRMVGVAVLLPLALGGLARAGDLPARGGGGSPPAGWEEGPVEVVRIFQPGIVQIGRDGRTIPLHLVGLDGLRRADGGLLRIALERVNEWMGDGETTLVDPRPGPSGSLVGSLRLDRGADLGELLLRNGFALYQPDGLSETFRDVFLGAQRQAALQEVGIWSLPKMETSDVPKLDGQIAKVCGDVLMAQPQADGSFLLYLGTYPHRELAIRIPEEHAAAFGAPDFAFVRQEVCVMGRVGQGDLLPEVTVFDAKQIEHLGMGQSF